MEKEEPYLSQENLEEQLKTWLNDYIYFEGGVSYEAPLLAYKGERLDYVVFHQRQWDSEETKARDKKYRVLVLLQPRNETLSTSMLSFSVYNDSMYSLSIQGQLIDRRVDFANSADVRKSFSELFGTDEGEKSKIWYTGTLSVGNGEEPQYMDFEGKKEKVDEICISVEDFLRGSEISGNVDIYIRNFNEHDGDTEILIESKDSDDSYILLPYCFYYKELNLQKTMELKKDEHFTYIEKFKRMSVMQKISVE